jgi:hypothetical protein
MTLFRRARSSRRTGAGVRPAQGVLLVAAAITLAAAAVVWLDARDRTVKERTVTVTTAKTPHTSRVALTPDPGCRGLSAGQRATRRNCRTSHTVTRLRAASHSRVLVSKTTPVASGGSSPVLLALLAVTAAFALASAFFARVTEMGFLGVSIKLGPVLAEAVRDMDAQTPAGQAAGVFEEFFAVLRRLFVDKGDLSIDDVERAKREALESRDDARRNITVSGSGPSARVRVESPTGRMIKVTTASQWLPQNIFSSDRVQTLDGADEDMGRRLYAIDTAASQVVAALSYELLGTSGAVVVAPLLVDLGAGVVAYNGAVELVDHVRALTELLGRPRFAVRADGPADRNLMQAVGLRPLSPAEAADMPDGEYWG